MGGVRVRVLVPPPYVRGHPRCRLGDSAPLDAPCSPRRRRFSRDNRVRLGLALPRLRGFRERLLGLGLRCLFLLARPPSLLLVAELRSLRICLRPEVRQFGRRRDPGQSVSHGPIDPRERRLIWDTRLEALAEPPNAHHPARWDVLGLVVAPLAGEQGHRFRDVCFRRVDLIIRAPQALHVLAPVRDTVLAEHELQSCRRRHVPVPLRFPLAGLHGAVLDVPHVLLLLPLVTLGPLNEPVVGAARDVSYAGVVVSLGADGEGRPLRACRLALGPELFFKSMGLEADHLRDLVDVEFCEAEEGARLAHCSHARRFIRRERFRDDAANRVHNSVVCFNFLRERYAVSLYQGEQK